MVREHLLERGADLDAIDRALDDARDGHGRVVVVEGHAGIGKSALLDATRDRARASGMAVAGARASELEREFPFGVAVQLFEPFLRSAGDDLLGGAAAAARP